MIIGDISQIAISNSVKDQHWIQATSVRFDISKMYFSQWEPPGVSERRQSVNLEASMSGENQTLGGHSGRPSE
jgi:hypothetical protein